MQALVLYQKMGFFRKTRRRGGESKQQGNNVTGKMFWNILLEPPLLSNIQFIYLSVSVSLSLSLSRLLLLECSGRVFKKKGSKWKMKDGRWELSTAAGEIFPPPPPARRSSEQRGGGGKEPHARRGRFVFVTFTSVFPSDPFLGWFVLLLVSRTGLSVNKKTSERFSLALWWKKRWWKREKKKKM